jgi:hypothetical protein
VICSRGIGDLSDMVEQAQVGVVLTEGEPDPAYKALELVWKVHREPGLRQQTQQLAKAKLSWPAQLDTYRLGYSRQEFASAAGKNLSMFSPDSQGS